MRTGVVVALLAAACGRVDFDATALRGDASDVPADAAHRAPADVLRYFPFDDDPSDGVDNFGVPGKPVHCLSTFPAQIAGKRGGAYHFNGATDVVLEEDSADLHTAAGSVAMWLRFADLPGDNLAYEIASRTFGSANQNSWELFLANFTADGAPMLYGGGDAIGNDAYGITPAEPANTWFHFALTWDTETKIFINGVEAEHVQLLDAMYDTHPLVIGADFNSGAYGEFGAMDVDEVIVMARALTDQELRDLASP